MCVFGQPEPVDSVLTFPSGYDTLEYSWVKAIAVSVRLRIFIQDVAKYQHHANPPQNYLQLDTTTKNDLPQPF